MKIPRPGKVVDIYSLEDIDHLPMAVVVRKGWEYKAYLVEIEKVEDFKESNYVSKTSVPDTSKSGEQMEKSLMKYGSPLPCGDLEKSIGVEVGTQWSPEMEFVMYRIKK
jgi:hypothetical protein